MGMLLAHAPDMPSNSNRALASLLRLTRLDAEAREATRLKAQLVRELEDFRSVISKLSLALEDDRARLTALAPDDHQRLRFEQSIEAKTEEVSRVSTLLEAERRRVEPALERWSATLRRLREERERLLDGVEPMSLKRYESAAQRGRFPVIVPVRDGRCSGCVLELSAPLLEELQRDPVIGDCPRCARMLYARRPNA